MNWSGILEWWRTLFVLSGRAAEPAASPESPMPPFGTQLGWSRGVWDGFLGMLPGLEAEAARLREADLLPELADVQRRIAIRAAVREGDHPLPVRREVHALLRRRCDARPPPARQPRTPRPRPDRPVDVPRRGTILRTRACRFRRSRRPSPRSLVAAPACRVPVLRTRTRARPSPCHPQWSVQAVSIGRDALVRCQRVWVVTGCQWDVLVLVSSPEAWP